MGRETQGKGRQTVTITQHWNGVSILCPGNWIILFDKTIYCKNAFFVQFECIIM